MTTHYTVKKLSEMANISIKTLHYYDEIGLLKPAYQGDNGYRYYREQELLQLQQILFFKKFGCSLKQIKSFLLKKDFDAVSSLLCHRKGLLNEFHRISQLIETIDQTIRYLKGDDTMELFKLFKGFASEKEVETVQNFSKEDWIAYSNGLNELIKALAELQNKGIASCDPEAQNLMLNLYNLQSRISSPDRDSYIALAKTYPNESMRLFFASFDPDHPKLATYLCDAMICFAEHNLVNSTDTTRKLAQVEAHSHFVDDLSCVLKKTNDWEEQVEDVQEIFAKLAQLYKEELPAESTQTQKMIDLYFKWMSKMQPMDKEAFLKLAKLYITPDWASSFATYSDAPQEFAHYLSDAIKIYVTTL